MKKDKLQLTENSRIVLEKRYLAKDVEGKVMETPEAMIERVSQTIARAESKYKAESKDWVGEFYNMMSQLKFLPNSPTLMNAGRELGQLSACFVLPVEDSMEGIFDSIKSAALIHKSGGGTGFSFSRLRSKGATVKSTGGVASGPISFMKVFNSATEAVKQGGCVDENTRISTVKGLVKIKDLGPCDLPEDSWHKYDLPLKLYTDEGIKEADEFYVHGKANVKKITTECGYSVTITHNHRLRVIDSEGNYVWKYAEDIKKGDWLALKKNTYPETTDYKLPEFIYEPHFNAKEINLPQGPTEDLGEFIGYFIGDGSISFNEKGTGRVIFSVADNEPEVLDRIITLGKSLFSIEPVISKKPGDKSSNLFYNSTVLAHWLKHISVDKVSSMDVRVPEIAFRAGTSFAVGFLRGLFSADGSVSKEGYVTLYSISKELVDGVKQLLLSLGIPSRTIINADRRNSFGKNPIFRLNLITQEGYKIFRDKVGFISALKNDRLDVIDNRAWEFNDIIPNQQQVFAQIYDGPGRGCGPNRMPLGANRELYRDIQHYLPHVAALRNLNHSRLSYLVKKHPEIAESPLKWFLENDQFYDRVETVEDDKAYTLDLSVPNNNTYIAAGFISHNTRRGANMGILRVDHPDILDFIKCKQDDKEITNFNISVAITDKFMEALKKDEEYDLVDPHTNKPTGKLKAREVFDLIVDMAWNNGEPGIVFIDKMNKDNPTPKVGAIESTNPCVTGDTLVAMEEGLVRIDELYARHKKGGFKIVTDNRVPMTQLMVANSGQLVEATPDMNTRGTTLNPVIQVYNNGKKDVMHLVTKSGYQLKATPGHRFLTTEGWKELKDIKGADEILIQSGEGSFAKNDKLPFQVANKYMGRNGRTYTFNFPKKWSRELGQVLGWLVGDGWLRDNDENCRIGFTFGKDDIEILGYLRDIINGMYGKDIREVKRKNGVYHLSYHSKYMVNFFKDLGVKSVGAQEKEVPSTLFKAPYLAIQGFLQALFAADGTVRTNSKPNSEWVALTSKSKKLLTQVQMLLLNFGIKSVIINRSRKPQKKKFRYVTVDGEERFYDTDGVLYELGIFGASRERFRQKIGFLMSSKNQSLDNIVFDRFYTEKFYDEVELVEYVGKETVYDLTEPVTHSMICNGIVIHQCGEQPLLPYESCNLGSINLAKFVKKSGNKSQIDYESLKETVHKAVRFLDDVIDVNRYPLKEIEEMTLSNRKIGLGVMGFADLLIQLRIPYNSEEAVKMAEEVMSFIDKESKNASTELAKERGVFPNWDKSIFKENGVEIRNATTTTIAPTGTISIIAGASSGIEPIFALAFERHVMDNERLVEVHPLFKEALSRQDLYTDELMQKVIEQGTLQEIEGLSEDMKRIFITAHDITPEWHIKIQAAFQKYTDNAVSKTVNFPNSATREDVKTVYMMAYELGCKGVTIYRDGSRQEQVLNKGTKDEGVNTKILPPECEDCPKVNMIPGSEIKPRPRPNVTYGNTEKVKIGCGNLYITVNSDENSICEVFTNLGRAGGCPSQSEATSRLISMALRSGIDVKSIVEQLKGIRCHSTLRQMANNKEIKVLSCPDAIGRAIERSIGKNILVNGNNHESNEAYIKRYVDAGVDEMVSSKDLSMNTGKKKVAGATCPECGHKLEHESGCVMCRSCGYSKCG